MADAPLIRRDLNEPLFRAGRTLWSKQTPIALWLFTADTPRDVITPEGPDYRLTAQDAQVLMDDLWSAGVRPTEGSGSAGSLAATERHLKEISGLLHQVLPRALRHDE